MHIVCVLCVLLSLSCLLLSLLLGASVRALVDAVSAAEEAIVRSALVW